MIKKSTHALLERRPPSSKRFSHLKSSAQPILRLLPQTQLQKRRNTGKQYEYKPPNSSGGKALPKHFTPSDPTIVATDQGLATVLTSDSTRRGTRSTPNSSLGSGPIHRTAYCTSKLRSTNPDFRIDWPASQEYWNTTRKALDTGATSGKRGRLLPYLKIHKKIPVKHKPY